MTHIRILRGLKIGALIGVAVGIIVALSHVPDCPPLYKGCAEDAWGIITAFATLGAIIGGMIGLAKQWSVRNKIG